MNKIDYSEIEDDVYKIILDYSKNENNKFYFSELDIFLIVDDKIIDIPMKDYSESIAIYNRFKSNEYLYKKDIYKLDDIPVMQKVASIGNYALYYEDEYCTVAVRLQSVLDDKLIEICKSQIEKKVEELKKESRRKFKRNILLFYNLC